MEGLTLREAVSKITGQQVGPMAARIFADENFGELCAFIRHEQTKKLLKEKQEQEMLTKLRAQKRRAHFVEYINTVYPKYNSKQLQNEIKSF